MLTLTIIPYNSPQYESTKAFRERLLRMPLGFTLTENDMADEENHIHIAALDDSNTIIGTVILQPLSATAAKLRQIAIAEDRQGTGLGKEMMLFAEAVAREQGFTTSEMDARVTVMGFYEKLGYQIAGEPFIKLTIPNIRMAKAL